MAEKWEPIPLGSKLFTNVKEAVLSRGSAAMENCFLNEANSGKAQSRFPGLSNFISLSGNKPTYLFDWRNDLMAVTGGRLYRIDQAGASEDVTGVPVGGDKRVVFDKTNDELVMAAGSDIIRFAGTQTEILSDDAPKSTHIGFIDDYVVAIEVGSGRFYHSESGEYRSWDPLDAFAADGKPDNINAMVITPYRELILTGEDSMEQFEPLSGSATPFFRRWAVGGDGVLAPYTAIAVDNGVWAVNTQYEFVRIAGQVADSTSDDIGKTLEDVDDWTGAWAARIHIQGQKFILLQIPYATNAYQKKGVTVLHDYRQGRWYNLYGWDLDKAETIRWPGWSYHKLWGRHFVGGEGKIYELTTDTYQNDSEPQRMRVRTGHVDKFGECRVDNVRVRVKRGIVANSATEPEIALRVKRDNKNRTRWVRRGLGTAGKKEMFVEFGGMGCGHTHQYEYMVTADCEVEVVSLDAQITPLRT